MTKSTPSVLIQAINDYKGEGFGYDVNSMHCSIMIKNIFLIPYRRGTFSIITFDQQIKSRVSCGIYRCTIDGDINNFLFRPTKSNYYKHTSINHAVHLGYKVNYIQDGKYNALQYKTDDYITGNRLFGKYVNYLYPLKKR